MRSYPPNSPQAAARILAFTLLADGHLGSSELAALHRLGAAGRLGLDDVDLSSILRDAVQDLLASGGAAWHGTAHLDAPVMQGVLAEIDDPALRAEVLSLCRSVAAADRHVSDGEQAFLAALAGHWNMPARAAA